MMKSEPRACACVKNGRPAAKVTDSGTKVCASCAAHLELFGQAFRENWTGQQFHDRFLQRVAELLQAADDTPRVTYLRSTGGW